MWKEGINSCEIAVVNVDLCSGISSIDRGWKVDVTDTELPYSTYCQSESKISRRCDNILRHFIC